MLYSYTIRWLNCTFQLNYTRLPEACELFIKTVTGFEIRSYYTTKTKNTTSPNRKVQRPDEKKKKSSRLHVKGMLIINRIIHNISFPSKPSSLQVCSHFSQWFQWTRHNVAQEINSATWMCTFPHSIYIQWHLDKKIMYTLICSCVTFFVIKKLQSILKESHFGTPEDIF